MTKVYLDNAATTALDEEVKIAMINAMESFGNPSSTHAIGRKSKIVIEQARKKISKLLHCNPGEIFFTSGGTEADNIAIFCAVRDLGVKRIISSAIEHHAVGHSFEFLQEKGEVRVDILPIDEKGRIDLNDLEELLKEDIPTLVTLMHANNEIGNILDIDSTARICKKYNALFHSDTVQSVGHRHLDLSSIPVDFITFAAHKIHGPKGSGFLFVRGGLKIDPLIMGGGQERNMRAGTENIIGIAGMSKAIELAYQNLEKDREHILGLKKYAIERIKSEFPEIKFNGLSDDLEKSLFTVLSLALPKNENTELLLFSLDIKGIAASGGSACNSGSSKGSHVMEALHEGKEPIVSLRISFSKYNTKSDLDYFFTCLHDILKTELAVSN